MGIKWKRYMIGLNYRGIGNKHVPVFRQFAHRGHSAVYPENTLISYGADDVLNPAKFNRWIEGDCQITSDGEFVMMHDYTLNRTTNGSGYVDSKTLAYIKGLDAGSWKNVSFAGTEVPTWAEVAAQCASQHTKFFFEMLDRGGDWSEAECAEAISIWLDAGNPIQNLLVQSFDIGSLDNMRAINTEVELYLCDGSYTIAQLVSMVAARPQPFGLFVNKDLTATETNMATFIAAGIKVNVYTLTTSGEKTTMIARGAVGIASDSYLS